MKINYFDIAKSAGAAAVKKAAQELRDQGFKVEEEKRVGNERIDLFAEKGNERTVYEFRAGRSTLRKEQYEKLQEIAKELSAKLKIVYVVPPPTEIQIQFDELPSIIKRDLQENKSTVISGISGFDITDLTITKIQVNRSCMNVEGSGIIECVTSASSNLYFILTLDMQLNVIKRQYDYPELKLSLNLKKNGVCGDICDINDVDNINNINDYYLPNNSKQQYEILAKDILGDAFYSQQSSYRKKINKEQQYSELVLKKLLNSDETFTNRQFVINRINTLPDRIFILNALERIRDSNIAIVGFPQRVITEEDYEEDYERVTDALFDLLASLLINYFGKYKFGSRPEIMRTFSLLPPVIRRKVLLYLYENPHNSTNITAQTGKENVALIDKLVLAILKADGYEKAREWLEEHRGDLAHMKAIDLDFYERAKHERGKEYADFLYNTAPTMYQSCLEKIEILGKQIEREGAMYLDFESAKPYYEQKGFIYGDDEETKKFNDIMEFLYMGRRVNVQCASSA